MNELDGAADSPASGSLLSRFNQAAASSSAISDSPPSTPRNIDDYPEISYQSPPRARGAINRQSLFEDSDDDRKEQPIYEQHDEEKDNEEKEKEADNALDWKGVESAADKAKVLGDLPHALSTYKMARVVTDEVRLYTLCTIINGMQLAGSVVPFARAYLHGQKLENGEIYNGKYEKLSDAIVALVGIAVTNYNAHDVRKIIMTLHNIDSNHFGVKMAKRIIVAAAAKNLNLDNFFDTRLLEPDETLEKYFGEDGIPIRYYIFNRFNHGIVLSFDDLEDTASALFKRANEISATEARGMIDTIIENQILIKTTSNEKREEFLARLVNLLDAIPQEDAKRLLPMLMRNMGLPRTLAKKIIDNKLSTGDRDLLTLFAETQKGQQKISDGLELLVDNDCLSLKSLIEFISKEELDNFNRVKIRYLLLDMYSVQDLMELPLQRIGLLEPGYLTRLLEKIAIDNGPVSVKDRISELVALKKEDGSPAIPDIWNTIIKVIIDDMVANWQLLSTLIMLIFQSQTKGLPNYLKSYTTELVEMFIICNSNHLECGRSIFENHRVKEAMIQALRQSIHDLNDGFAFEDPDTVGKLLLLTIEDSDQLYTLEPHIIVDVFNKMDKNSTYVKNSYDQLDNNHIDMDTTWSFLTISDDSRKTNGWIYGILANYWKMEPDLVEQTRMRYRVPYNVDLKNPIAAIEASRDDNPWIVILADAGQDENGYHVGVDAGGPRRDYYEALGKSLREKFFTTNEEGYQILVTESELSNQKESIIGSALRRSVLVEGLPLGLRLHPYICVCLAWPWMLQSGQLNRVYPLSVIRSLCNDLHDKTNDPDSDWLTILAPMTKILYDNPNKSQIYHNWQWSFATDHTGKCNNDDLQYQDIRTFAETQCGDYSEPYYELPIVVTGRNYPDLSPRQLAQLDNMLGILFRFEARTKFSLMTERVDLVTFFFDIKRSLSFHESSLGNYMIPPRTIYNIVQGISRYNLDDLDKVLTIEPKVTNKQQKTLYKTAFMDALRQLDADGLKRVVAFWSGSTMLTSSGWRDKIGKPAQIRLIDQDWSRVPDGSPGRLIAAHTCFFQLDLPRQRESDEADQNKLTEKILGLLKVISEGSSDEMCAYTQNGGCPTCHRNLRRKRLGLSIIKH
jgi:hypothetical protein